MSNYEFGQEYLDKLEPVIEKFGWAVQGVFAIEDDDPTWVYTVGLEDNGHPELMVSMYDIHVAHGLLNRIAQECLEGNHPWPVPGTYLDWLNDDYPLAVVEVDEVEALTGEWFNVAFARRDSRNDLRVLQLVWCDENHQYPDDTWQPSTQVVLGEKWWLREG